MYADAGVNATDGTVINSTQENAAASNATGAAEGDQGGGA